MCFLLFFLFVSREKEGNSTHIFKNLPPTSPKGCECEQSQETEPLPAVTSGLCLLS